MRALVLVAIVALLAPASIPVFAGLAHRTYHSVAAGRHGEVAHGHDGARHDAPTAHSHTPGGELHTHVPIVDTAIAMAGGGGETQLGPPPSHQVDPYAPPITYAFAPAPAARSFDYGVPARPSERLISAPPVPPPRG